MFKNLLIILVLKFSFSIHVNAQTVYNRTSFKYVIDESQDLRKNKASKNWQFIFYQHFYLNSNLPNLENNNGLYFPKGFGMITATLLEYKSKYLTFSAEPHATRRKIYPISPPKKESIFSTLNDVQLNEIKINNIKNLGIKLNYNNITLGFGNWNQWWGPGIHNSLAMTNNSLGFYHSFLKMNDYVSITTDIKMKAKYVVSNPINNILSINYYLSFWESILRYKDIEAGLTRHVLSGGNEKINWNYLNAATVLLTNKNINYWDEIIDLYIKYNPKNSGLIIFIELGMPNRQKDISQKNIYSDNSLGSNIGIRKYGVFDNEKIMLGIEYTRLIQGIYYNLIPTPNWYDNVKFDYSSYGGRRWAAHSGSDSDDLLMIIGLLGENKKIIAGFNYERHGVNFNFPPEVKLEFRLSTSFNINNFSLTFEYESEYYEHYGFVDNAENVWNNTFEAGSIQRTKTLLFTIEKSLKN